MALKSQEVTQLPQKQQMPLEYDLRILQEYNNSLVQMIKALQEDVKALDAQLNP